MSNKQDVQLFDHAGRVIPSVKSLPTNVDREFYHWGYNTGSEITARDIETQPYRYHSLIFACCTYITRNVSRLPWYMYNLDEPETFLHDHPVLDLLRKPHPLLTKTTFLQAIMLSILLPSGGAGKKAKGGQCFILCMDEKGNHTDLTRGDIPVLLMPMNDNFITAHTVKADNGLQTVLGWKFEVPSEPASKDIYLTNEIIRVSQFNPYSWVEGISNYHPAATALMLDLKSDLYNDSIFSNFGVPTGVISTEQPLTPEQRREEMRHWVETMGGLSNAQKVAIMSKGLTYKHIGLTNVDMQYSEMKDFIKKNGIMSFGVNRIALGDYEKINYATIREGRKMLWHDVNLPMAEMICEALNYDWIRYIDKNLRIGLDTSKVEYLKTDNKPRAETAAILVDKCFLPPAMALRKANIILTDDELKEAPWLNSNPTLLKPQKINNPSGDDDDDDDDDDIYDDGKGKLKLIEKKEPTVSISQDEKDNWWYGYVERVLNPNEKKYIKILRSFFDEQRNDIQDKVDDWRSKQDRHVRAIEFTLDDILIDRRKQDDKILRVSKPIHKDQLELTEEQLKVELGQLVAWNVTDDTVDKSINRRAKFLRGLNNTTFKSVQDEALELFNIATAEDWTPGEFAKEIKKKFNSIYERRKNQAMTIARTEIGSVTEDARYVAFVMEDIQYHQWVSAADEKVRVSHAQENTHIVKVGIRFPVTNLLHPLDDSGLPEEVINCRCVNVAVENP